MFAAVYILLSIFIYIKIWNYNHKIENHVVAFISRRRLMARLISFCVSLFRVSTLVELTFPSYLNVSTCDLIMGYKYMLTQKRIWYKHDPPEGTPKYPHSY